MWVESLISQAIKQDNIQVLNPFAGLGITLLVAEKLGTQCYGIEAHPFVARVARAKLLYKTDVGRYREHILNIIKIANNIQGNVQDYPKLIRE